MVSDKRHIAPRISEDEALEIFTRPRFSWFGRPVEFFPTASPEVRPSLELVWLPSFIVPFHVNSRKGAGVITVSVEAWSGAFAIFEMHDMVESGGPLEGELFEPRLGEPEAIAQGRDNLLHTILRQRSFGPKPEIRASGEVELLHYPFWVYYYERRPGRLDIKLIDAVTGAKGGAKTKSGLLAAFQAASKPADANSNQH